MSIKNTLLATTSTLGLLFGQISAEVSSIVSPQTFSNQAIFSEETASIIELNQFDPKIEQWLLDLNPDENELISKQVWPKVLEVYKEFSLVEKWTSHQIREWCSLFKSMQPDAQTINISKLIAVLMRASKLANGYVPRTTQVVSVLAAFDVNTQQHSRFLQVSTGEGKTLITAMTAAAHALMGKFVDILSTTRDLCSRDCKKEADFYQMIGVGATLVDAYENRAVSYGFPVVYGTPLDFQGDELRNARFERSYDNSILLMDEVDSLCIDQLSHLTQLSKNISGMEGYLPLLALMAGAVVDYHKQGVPDEEIELRITDIALRIVRGEIDGVQLRVCDRLRALALQQAPTWAREAVDVMLHTQEDVSHVLQSNGDVFPLEYTHTGSVNHQQAYGNGRHQLLQLKHYGYLKPEGPLCQFVSTLTFIKKYKGKIYGFTGTLGDQYTKDFMHELFNVTFLTVPTFAKKNLTVLAPQLLNRYSDWALAISNSCLERSSKGQAVLALFETIHDLNVYKKELDSTIVNKFVEEKRKEFLSLSEEDFQSKLKELQPELKARLDKVLVYSRNDLHQLPSVLSEGQILLATNLAGRGADIDITKSVEKAGGLHVCITFLPINERVEDQNIGRTARRGQPGTAEMILNLSPLYDSGLIFRSEQAITVDLVRRRREERVRQQLSQILHSETKKRMLHDSYYAQVHALSLKLGGGARKQNEAYRIVDAKLDELMELWALQYHQISSQAVYATQEKELSDQIKLLADPLDENAIGFRVTHALEPDVLFELIAKELSISRETLQQQFLMSVWTGLSNKNPSLFEKKLLSYLEQPLTMLERLSRLTQTTMVVVDQKGKISVFRGGDKKTIVLGESYWWARCSKNVGYEILLVDV